MNYTGYSTEDFLANESFQSFVLASDPEAAQFWQSWVLQHPAKAAEFDEAVAVLQMLVSRQHKPVSESLRHEELAKLWRSMRPPMAPRAQPALRSGRERARRWAAALATSVVLLLVGWGLWWRSAPAPVWALYATHPGEHREVVLPDSSRVVLNANSALRLAPTWQPGQAREVWLKGEAYFDVRHTAPARVRAVATAPPNVKFVVHAGALDVAVLGTRFNVFSRVGKIRVVLNAGQIQLSRQSATFEPVLLKPGELVEYNEATPRAPLVKRIVKPDFYSAWTEGQLNFKDTPVAEIIALLEDTYGLRITLGHPALARQKLTGSVPSYDLDVLLNAIGKSLDVKIRRKGNYVWLD